MTGWARNSAASGVYTIYRWQSGQLVLVRRIETHYPEGDVQRVTVEDLLDGQMTQVYEDQVDLTQHKEGDPLLDERWYDLDYKG